MAPVILAMDVHCDSCAKKIRKAVMKVPGVESVTASFETGLVVVEGTADAAALRARLQSKTKKDVNVVSDGAHDGEADSGGAGGGSSSSSPPSSPAAAADPPAPAAAPIVVLEMELHCRACADKVERRVMEIPGVDTVTTDVPGRRVEVTGTADASAVATSLEVRTGKPVRVVSDPRSADAPGHDHESRKAAAARATAQQMQEMYGGTTSSYGAPPPQDGYYYNYPEPGGGAYGGQGGQQWPESEAAEGYYPYGGQQDENPGGCCVQ